MCLLDRVRLVTGAASGVGRPVPLRAALAHRRLPQCPPLHHIGRMQEAAATLAHLAFNESRLALGSAHVIDGGAVPRAPPYRPQEFASVR